MLSEERDGKDERRGRAFCLDKHEPGEHEAVVHEVELDSVSVATS